MTSCIVDDALWEARVQGDPRAKDLLELFTAGMQADPGTDVSVPDTLTNRSELLAHTILSSGYQEKTAEWSISAEQAADFATLASDLSTSNPHIVGLADACARAIAVVNRSISTDAPDPSTFGIPDTLDEVLGDDYLSNMVLPDFRRSFAVRAIILLLTSGYPAAQVAQAKQLCSDIWSGYRLEAEDWEWAEC